MINKIKKFLACSLTVMVIMNVIVVNTVYANEELDLSVLAGEFLEFAYESPDIYNCLSAGEAIIGQFITDGNKGHSVVIQGYQASTSGSFLRIMDPMVNSYSIIFNVSGSWEIVMPSGYIFYWYHSIRCQ